MLFLLATAIVASSVEEEEEEEIEMPPVGEDFAYAPESDYADIDDDYGDEAVIPAQPSAEELKFLNECLTKMTPVCAKEVFSYMFEDLDVAEACCRELVAMGEPCHIGLVKTIFSFPEYQGNASLGVPRSKQVWNKCAFVVVPYASSPIPLKN
ncbi:hypothetical protein DITRI_Ditri07aG0022300 [Diplodiscus trichospermus]